MLAERWNDACSESERVNYVLSPFGDDCALEVGIPNSLNRGKLVMTEVPTAVRAKHLIMHKPDQAPLAKDKKYGKKSKKSNGKKKEKCVLLGKSGHYLYECPDKVCSLCRFDDHDTKYHAPSPLRPPPWPRLSLVMGQKALRQ